MQSGFQRFRWDCNSHVQLGAKRPDQLRVGRSTLVRRSSGPLEDAVRVSVGSTRSCAIASGGFLPTAVYGRGRNQGGSLGVNVTSENSHFAIEVPGLVGGTPMPRISEIAAADCHGCVLVHAGGVRCRGDSTLSQPGRFLGDVVWITPVAGPGAFVHQFDGVAGPHDRVFASGWQEAR